MMGLIWSTWTEPIRALTFTTFTYNLLVMLFYIAYAFISLATAIAVYDGGRYSRNELIASAITGAAWPLLLTVRVITKLLN